MNSVEASYTHLQFPHSIIALVQDSQSPATPRSLASLSIPNIVTKLLSSIQPLTWNVITYQSDTSAGEVYDDISGAFFGNLMIDDDDTSDEDDEDSEESSVDLFIRFMQTMFKKLSKRAKRASRSVLPIAISPQLVLPSLLNWIIDRIFHCICGFVC